jgi:hypothetical protein
LFLSCEETQTILDPKDAAEAADLRYVSDERPGIRRKKSGKGFIYLRADGTRVSDPRVLGRIRSLAVPPAWTDVWICPFSNGHIQATGRDARGRKQYRYHPLFRDLRESTKFEHVVAFAEALPVIRAKVHEHMGLRGLPREKVLATVWPSNRRISRPLAASHSRSVLSVEPEAMCRPSGEKTTDCTESVWPSKRRISRPLAASHSRSVLSIEPEKRNRKESRLNGQSDPSQLTL